MNSLEMIEKSLKEKGHIIIEEIMMDMKVYNEFKNRNEKTLLPVFNAVKVLNKLYPKRLVDNPLKVDGGMNILVDKNIKEELLLELIPNIKDFKDIVEYFKDYNLVCLWTNVNNEFTKSYWLDYDLIKHISPNIDSIVINSYIVEQNITELPF